MEEYRLDKVIGVGQFANVYRAREMDGTEVALKLWKRPVKAAEGAQAPITTIIENIAHILIPGCISKEMKEKVIQKGLCQDRQGLARQ